MEEFLYEGYGNCTKDRRPGKGGNPKGDKKNTADKRQG